MFEYPSIQSSNGTKFREFDAYVFDKLDGSNLRFEWSKKKGFHRFGTRHRIMDRDDQQFPDAIQIFENTLSERFSKYAKDNHLDKFTVFCEYLGMHSFAGNHDSLDNHYLVPFDVVTNNSGLMGPKDFLNNFGDIGPNFIGQFKWTRDLVDCVYNEETPFNLLFEGVIGKANSGHKIILAKAKTKSWLDTLKLKHPNDYDNLK